MKRILAVITFMAIFSLARVARGVGTFTLLHTFDGGPGGDTPLGQLTMIGNTLIGTTQFSGPVLNSEGTMYSINTAGTDFQILHSFRGGIADGMIPYAGVTPVGERLYGTTDLGGSSSGDGGGTVYSTNRDGTDLQVLHAFDPGPNSVSGPFWGNLVTDGSSLYGTTRLTGAADFGSIYKLNADGTGFQTLHSFAGSPGDGAIVGFGLTLGGSTLFGMTDGGGATQEGTPFAVNTNGSGYHVLHSFGGADGSVPQSNLLLVGSTLYGTTAEGGTSGLGAIFAMNIDGSDYHVLHSFAGGAGDGQYPQGGLVLINGQLYGTAPLGGATDNGVLYEIHPDGTGFQLLHSFNGSGDGNQPQSPIIAFENTIYGTASFGGAQSAGTMWSMTVPEPSAMCTAIIGGLGLAAWRWRVLRRRVRQTRR